MPNRHGTRREIKAFKRAEAEARAEVSARNDYVGQASRAELLVTEMIGYLPPIDPEILDVRSDDGTE